MYFPTTQWTLLAHAALEDESSARQALGELCHRYWKPLHQFIRARGHGEEDAQDLTQAFIVHLLEHSTLKRADRTQGRFRSFLLGALKRFLADERDRRHAQKRGEGAVHVATDEAQIEAADSQTEISFDREWALIILENALTLLQTEWEGGNPGGFNVLRQFLPGSIVCPTYEQAAQQVGKTLPAFKSELHRMRQRFRALVRQEIAATVSAPHEIEEEMQHLQRILMDRGSDLSLGQKPSVENS